MRNLAQGDNGTDVCFAQKLCNKFVTANDVGEYLTADGDFGPKTRDTVKAIQKWYKARYGAFIPTDGAIAGDTWRALGAAPGVTHPLKLVPQYNSTTCWEACMNMLLGSSKCREMPASMLGPNRLLLDDRNALQHYASLLGRSLASAPNSIRALQSLVSRRPIVVFGRSSQYATGGHAVVVNAVWWDKQADPDTAVIRVLNPSPVNRGRTEPSTYYPLMEVERDCFSPVWVVA